MRLMLTWWKSAQLHKRAQYLILTETPRPMKPYPTTRDKIQDVLDALSSKEVFLDSSGRYTKAEMIEWCASWVKIYDKLPQNTSPM